MPSLVIFRLLFGSPCSHHEQSNGGGCDKASNGANSQVTCLFPAWRILKAEVQDHFEWLIWVCKGYSGGFVRSGCIAVVPNQGIKSLVWFVIGYFFFCGIFFCFFFCFIRLLRASLLLFILLILLICSLSYASSSLEDP